MLFSDVSGREVEIPSLETAPGREDDEYYKVTTLDDLNVLTKAMGWDDGADFCWCTGYKPEELLGVFWTVDRDRVYFLADEVPEQTVGRRP